jgi:capsular polysaccharide biosynthesis protein
MKKESQILKETKPCNPYMRFFLLLILIIISPRINAQTVFSVSNKYDADIKVFVAKNKYDSDLVVFKAKNKYDCKDNNGVWFFTKNKYDASKTIYFVKNKYDADLIIYFAKNKYDAKWREKSKMHLLY